MVGKIVYNVVLLTNIQLSYPVEHEDVELQLLIKGGHTATTFMPECKMFNCEIISTSMMRIMTMNEYTDDDDPE
uniref:Uncharacterized protein n=1 Tax=Romanomermis culicivorax TaxID=13658 RepID=A0A915KH34_ROMCU